MTESHTPAQLSTVVSSGDRRQSLQAMRDVLARDADDVTWEKHKRECVCVCGMGDGRTRVAIIKQLHALLDAIDALPGVEGVTRLDGIAAGVADEVAVRRNRRFTGTDSP